MAMANDMCVRRLTRELKALRKDPLTDPRIVAVPNETNILEWHYVIEGVGPYQGGYYHGKLIFPREYPLKPPSVLMLTPSGRFQPNRRLCLSMSDFHPESWNPMWSVSTILTGLHSFMIETAPTLGSIEASTSQKRRLAAQSLDFNVRDDMFCKLFPEYVELHMERLAERQRLGGDSAVSSETGTAMIPVERGELHGLLAAAAGILAIVSIFFAMRFI
jgi:ubiquitin-conjugating enzyme E2 J2